MIAAQPQTLPQRAFPRNHRHNRHADGTSNPRYVDPADVLRRSTSNRLLRTITDQGPGFDDPFADYLPAGGKYLAHGGRGLWLARQLCDQLDTYRTPEGFTVRLTIGGGLRAARPAI